jgi:hypothetical protein
LVGKRRFATTCRQQYGDECMKNQIIHLRLCTSMGQRFRVVADGPNLIHSNVCGEHEKRNCRECEKNFPDKSGEEWDLTFDCINAENLAQLCNKRNYALTIWMKRGTWDYAEGDRNNPWVDFELLSRLEKDGIVDVQLPEDEDLHWVQLALDTDAWIVTNDKLRKEKEKHPDTYDWNDVNDRLVEFVLSPNIAPKAIEQKLVIPQSILPIVNSNPHVPEEGDSELTKCKKENLRLQSKLIRYEKEIRSLATKARTAGGGLTPQEDKFKDLICSVWLELVSKDVWIECSILYLQLAHRVLDCNDHPKNTFGEEWKNKFRSVLGYSHTAKTSTILEDQMNIVIKETGRTPKFNTTRTRVKFLD